MGKRERQGSNRKSVSRSPSLCLSLSSPPPQRRLIYPRNFADESPAVVGIRCMKTRSLAINAICRSVGESHYLSRNRYARCPVNRRAHSPGRTTRRTTRRTRPRARCRPAEMIVLTGRNFPRSRVISGNGTGESSGHHGSPPLARVTREGRIRDDSGSRRARRDWRRYRDIDRGLTVRRN